MCGIIGAIFNCSITYRNWISLIEGLHLMESRGPNDFGWIVLGKGDQNRKRNHIIEGDTTNFPYLSETYNQFLGHRRLSILDLSKAGHQPMSYDKKKYWISYNGEIYNYLELKSELEKFGHKFVSKTDTEVILASYCEWGEKCFEYFNGMWAISIIDLEKQRLILSRDRFGIKPLYYYKDNNGIFFASEIKALLTASGIPRIASEHEVSNFILHGLQPTGEKTYFKNIYQIRSGSYVAFDLNSLKVINNTRWWRIKPVLIPEKSLLEYWSHLFADSVQLRLRSDVTVGSCLSGGIDSSLIAGTMAQYFRGQNDIYTVTSCYEEKQYDESYYAQLVVNKINAKPIWVYPKRDYNLAQDLKNLILAQEQPFPTLSIYSQYCVMRAARDAGITVLLDGQGGDELFFGYNSSFAFLLSLLIKKFKINKAVSSAQSYLKNNNNISLVNLIQMIMFFGYPRLRMTRNILKMKSYLKEDYFDKNNLQTRTLLSNNKDLNEARIKWVEENPLPTLLHYEDRNSMAHSIETRLPFLDYRIINFAFGLDFKWLLNKGWSKYILRLEIEKYLPKAIAWRKNKMGFPAPTISFIEENRLFFSELFENNPKSSRFLKAKCILNN